MITVLLVIVIGLLVYVYYQNGKTKNQVNDEKTEVGETKIPQLFVDSPVYKNAYLISIPKYDANTELALTGFKVIKKALPDGSTEITLSAQNPEYKTQVYTVKPGEKLYFIEANLKDDASNNEKYLGDDKAVLVGSDGYVVSQ